MAKQSNKVASWYWVTTAILTPFLLAATLVQWYYGQQVLEQRAEGTRLVIKLQKDHEQLAPLVTHMKNVSGATGFKMAEPLGKTNDLADSAPRPKIFEGEEGERNAPPEKQSPLLRAYLDAEGRFYGAGAGSGGFLHEYMSTRAWLDEFEVKLKDYVAVKSYQYYTVQTIEIGGTGAAVASGNLYRPIDTADNIFVPTQGAVVEARQKFGEKQTPSDGVMQPPTRVTLELVFRKQSQLIRDLVSANLHQYNLLFADVSGMVTIVNQETGQQETHYVGFEGENRSLDDIVAKTGDLNRRIDNRRNESSRRLVDAREVASNAAIDTDTKDNRLQIMVGAADGRIEDLQDKFQNEKTTHETDAQAYEDMIRTLPRIKSPQKLEFSDADGEVTYSDYARRVVHLSLGHMDGVRAGQRFEIWRPHGFEKDEFVGVVEIIRTLSAHFSLCTVLSLTNDNDPVRKGDKAMSHFWQNGKFLSVALHGTFEPPNQSYSRERLTELLTQMGVKVVDKVQPGTDLVILGSNLLGDEWYRRARNDLRFDTLREEDIRLYVAPR
jgi:hypothetical protein